MSTNSLTDFLSQITDAADAKGDSHVPRKKQRTEETPEDTTFGYTEVNKFEHCARLLQKAIRTIIEDAPDVDELNLHINNHAVNKFARQEIQANGLLHLVAKLKTLYKGKELPIFDNVVDNKLALADTPRKPAAISLFSVKMDASDSEDEITGDSTLPPLPKINDARLRARVFQHKSTSANKTYLDELEIVLAHNERLEFLGDSVLNTVVTFILYARFPYANEGLLSQIRSQLVSNKTLAEFSTAYGFDQTLRCNIDEVSLRAGKQKIYADVFEAYLGALAMERGFDLKEVQQWLSKLMDTKLALAANEMKKLTPINKDAKTELYSLVGSASLHPLYRVVENGNGVQMPYKVHCMMEEDILGEGVAPGLRDAGLRAAMAALKNKTMLEKYGRRRLEADRSISVVRNEGEKEQTPGQGSDFPLVADKSTLANKFAKNEVYAFFGKTLGLNPEYHVAFDAENNRYKAELKVKETVVGVAYDASKKNAMSRAATVVLENKSKLNDLLEWVG